nr:MAG TPA: hypothetical protein [Caudoviricetes sp.]
MEPEYLVLFLQRLLYVDLNSFVFQLRNQY